MRNRRAIIILSVNLFFLFWAIYTIAKWRQHGDKEEDSEDMLEYKKRISVLPKNEAHFYVSSAYQLIHGSEKNTTRLIVLAPQNKENFKLQCQNQDGKLVKANIQSLGGAKYCSWWSYFIDCKFDEPATSLSLYNKEDESSVEIPIRQSNPERHNIVVCFAKMFMFEDWRVTLATIELYRAHGVDMFNIPIISVIESLYNILKTYEKMGIVKLTDGVILPKIFKDFDPNEETEYFNQVISNTECLYEYKNSKFILFADFDDFLVPRQYYNLYQELSMISTIIHPMGSSFEFYRDPNTKIKFARDPKKFDLDDSVAHIEMVDQKISPGKTVVIPQRVRNGFIHKPAPGEIFPGYGHVHLNESSAFILHFTSVFDETMEVIYPTYVNQIKWPSLQRSLFDLINSDSKAKRSYLRLPTKDLFLKSMQKCESLISKQLEENRPICPNVLRCNQKFEKSLYSKCTQLKVQYKQDKLGQKITIHQPLSTKISTGVSCHL